MGPNCTGWAMVDLARGLAWPGPAWPEPDSYAAFVLDALYWGELDPWDVAELQAEPGDFRPRVSGSISRAWATELPDSGGREAQVFARQWEAIRAIFGGSREERREALARIPATELDPIIRACPGVLRWCRGRGLKAP